MSPEGARSPALRMSTSEAAAKEPSKELAELSPRLNSPRDGTDSTESVVGLYRDPIIPHAMTPVLAEEVAEASRKATESRFGSDCGSSSNSSKNAPKLTMELPQLSLSLSNEDIMPKEEGQIADAHEHRAASPSTTDRNASGLGEKEEGSNPEQDSPSDGPVQLTDTATDGDISLKAPNHASEPVAQEQLLGPAAQASPTPATPQTPAAKSDEAEQRSYFDSRSALSPSQSPAISSRSPRPSSPFTGALYRLPGSLRRHRSTRSTKSAASKDPSDEHPPQSPVPKSPVPKSPASKSPAPQQTHTQHRMVMLSQNTQRNDSQMRAKPQTTDYSSQPSALEATAGRSLFPDLCHDSMYFPGVSSPPERPLTHGDVRRIYAELLAERDAAKPPTLSRRVGKFMRRMRGVKDSQPADQGSQIRARTQPYPVRRSAPPMPEDDQINVAGPDMLEAAMQGCQKSSVMSPEPMPTLQVGEYGNVVHFAEPVPEESEEEEEPETPAIAITSPSIEASLDQAPVPEEAPVQEADADTSSSSLVPTELVEAPRRRKKRSASALEAVTLPPALRSSTTLEPTVKPMVQAPFFPPSPSSVKQELPTLDDMVDTLGWEKALELIQQEKRNEPKSLRSTTRFRASGAENVPPGCDTPRSRARMQGTPGRPRARLQANGLR